MGRRHGRTPPYEIMQNVGSGAPLPRSGVRKVRGGSVGLLGLAWSGMKSAAVGIAELGSKIAELRVFRDIFGRFGSFLGRDAAEVRLTWPVLSLVGVAMLAGMGLMFQIGQHVAGRSAQGPGTSPVIAPDLALAESGSSASSLSNLGDTTTAESREIEADSTVVAMGTVPPGPVVSGRDRVVLTPVESPGGSGGIALTDPRAVGLNYFILATVRPSEVDGVRELQRFLADHGLETFLDSVNNGRLRVLVDVTRGFTREELRNLEHAEHEQRIRGLGRAWKQQQGGIGTDLRDIYRDRFDGPTQ